MASPTAICADEERRIEELVELFKSHLEGFQRLVRNVHYDLSESSKLRHLIHSTKYRVKDSSHLTDKLRRKLAAAKAGGNEFDITPDNLFERISDLAGVRLLHLHTSQMANIDRTIRELLEEYNYRLIEGPVANTWDDEYRSYFKSIGIHTVARDSMYTSVHYIIEANQKTKLRCELQVRTLMEEVWGEVSHAINYPNATHSVACREQLKVLARICSGGTRLVDSIFLSEKEHRDKNSTGVTAEPQ